MSKSYYSLGLMSGTSMDGVDASIIQSDGENKYKVILDKYFKYPNYIYEKLVKLRSKIKTSKDLKKLSKNIKYLEKEITLFHAQSIKKIMKKTKININFIGFHGQTIFHEFNKKMSIQLGDGKLLSKITKKTVVYNFRQKDLKNGGRGAPLTPIFHKALVKKNNIDLPAIILNIGGIANITFVDKMKKIFSYDIGPGNCLIDQWIRTNYENKKRYDKNGNIAKSGKVNKKILNKALDKWAIKNKAKAYDLKDFDLSFAKNLSLKDGAATLTEYTSEILYGHLHLNSWSEDYKIIATGGGRKNKFLIKTIEKKRNRPIKLIDDYGINGDFIESQAFAYLAIRSFLKLPISFPETTGVKRPCTGGLIVKN